MTSDVKRQYEADFAERTIKGVLEDNGQEVLRIMITDGPERLDIEGLDKFLEGISKKEDILWLLKDLNSRKEQLPDFISKSEDGTIEFHEVKNWKKVRLSQVKQKQALKELADEGFLCYVVRFFGVRLSDYSSEEGARRNLKLYGLVKQKKGIIPMKKAEIQTRSNIKKSSYPNIYMVDFEWRPKIN